jgi:hypothetical protein
MTFQPIKAATLMLFSGLFAITVASCGSNSTEEVEIPTKGLITTVVEVQAESFKIEDEIAIADTAASLIIAKYMSGKIDTFTLAEARLYQQGTGSSMGSGYQTAIFAAAGAGMLGYMMGRSMRTPPSPAAYRDQSTYNRVNAGAGSTIRNSTARVTRPTMGGSRSGSSSRSGSGFGSGRSSRSFGG